GPLALGLGGSGAPRAAFSSEIPDTVIAATTSAPRTPRVRECLRDAIRPRNIPSSPEGEAIVWRRTGSLCRNSSAAKEEEGRVFEDETFFRAGLTNAAIAESRKLSPWLPEPRDVETPAARRSAAPNGSRPRKASHPNTRRPRSPRPT